MPRRNRRAPAPTRGRRQDFRRGRPKPCVHCTESVPVDWKDAAGLRKYMSDRGKIRGRRVTGLCPKHQREVATATKNAREMGLLPYVSIK
jgi:small subunit ribosomal protein S18